MKKVTAETLNELLGIPELVVIEYAFEQQGDGAIVHIIRKHRYDVAVCPRCGKVSASLHESEMRCVRHLDIWGKMTLLHFPSRRFGCDKCKTPFTDLTADEETRLCAALDASATLRQAYVLKETFRTLCEKISDREQAARFLTAWIWQAEASGSPQPCKFANTLRNWWSEFLNYFHDRVTSGIVEGLYNAIRYVIRRTCGYHVFERFRLQVLVEHGGLHASH
jgi:transposase